MTFKVGTIVVDPAYLRYQDWPPYRGGFPDLHFMNGPIVDLDMYDPEFWVKRQDEGYTWLRAYAFVRTDNGWYSYGSGSSDEVFLSHAVDGAIQFEIDNRHMFVAFEPSE